MSKKRFYLSCTRERVGSNEGFWALDGGGYTTNLDKAHVYTLKEAQEKWNKAREIDVPLDADKVDALAKFKVDHQYIPSKTTITESEEYVAYYKNCYDGNDVMWATEHDTSYTYKDPIVYTREEATQENNKLIFIPKELAEKAKRRTIDVSIARFNYRKLITASGLITPHHIKNYRRRLRYLKQGGIRRNCPACGRINWQDHPYDFEGCNNKLCEEYKYK